MDGVIEGIKKSAPTVFSSAESSVDRCFELTLSSESPALIESLADYFTKYMQHVFSLSSHIKQLISEEKHEEKKMDFQEVASFGGWNSFRSSLELLRLSAQLSEQLHNFDKKLRTKLLSHKNFVFDNKLTRRQSNVTESDLLNGLVLALHLRDDLVSCNKLLAFFESLQKSTVLLVGPIGTFNSFQSVAASLVFEIAFGYVVKTLEKVPSLPCWNKMEKKKQEDESSSEEDEDVASDFNSTPSAYVRALSEHLFALPQQLQPFENDELIKRTLVATRKEKEEGLEEMEDSFVFHWVCKVSEQTCKEYVKRVLEIPSLTEKGVEQLRMDVEYFMNVLRAIDVPVDSDVMELFSLLSLSSVEVAEMSQDEKHEKTNLFAQISRMRGTPSAIEKN